MRNGSLPVDPIDTHNAAIVAVAGKPKFQQPRNDWLYQPELICFG
jgi:hypothetical protein